MHDRFLLGKAEPYNEIFWNLIWKQIKKDFVKFLLVNFCNGVVNLVLQKYLRFVYYILNI